VTSGLRLYLSEVLTGSDGLWCSCALDVPWTHAAVLRMGHPRQPMVLQTMTPAAAARDMTCADATVPTRGSALIPRMSHAALFYFVPCSSPRLIVAANLRVIA
jgi:hypothetical protein